MNTTCYENHVDPVSVDADSMLSIFPMQQRFLVERLLNLGISIEDVQLAALHPKFFSAASKMIMLLNTTRIQVLGKIHAEIRKCAGIVDQNIEPAQIQLFHDLLNLGLAESDIRKAMHNSEFCRFAILQVLKLKNVENDVRNALPQIIAKCKQHLPQSDHEQKNKRKRICEKPYKTIKRMHILNILTAHENGATLEEIVLQSNMSERRTRDALNAFFARGLFKRITIGHRYLWSILPKGTIELTDFVRTILQCELPDQYGNTHRKTVQIPSTQEITQILETVKIISNELKSLGWYPRRIRDVLEIHRPTYISSMIQKVKVNPEIRNPGAYLYSILFQRVSPKSRIVAIAKKALSELSQELKDIYIEIAQELRPAEFRYLANCLRKLYHRTCIQGRVITRGDVHGILNWVRKQLYKAKM